MSTLLAELSRKDIFNANDAYILRNYISRKSPFLSDESSSRVFADAVIRIVESRLPRLEAEQRKRLMEVLFKDAVCKPSFNIDCSDVFKAAVISGSIGNWFFREMIEWVGSTLDRPVGRENIFRLVIQTRKMMSDSPGTGVEQIMEAIENEMDITERSDPDTNRPHAEAINKLSIDTADTSLTADAGMAELNDFTSQHITESGKVIKKCLHERLKSLFYIGAGLKIPSGRSAVLAGFAGLIISSLLPVGPVLMSSEKNHLDLNYTGTYYSTEQYIGTNDLLQYDRLNRHRQTFNDSKTSTEGLRKMRATAYDLSVESCGKLPSEQGYGITRSGARATVGRTVAVDPDVIPLGSKLYISFPDKYKHMDGIYYAEDTGRLIKGEKVDVFFGEDKQGSNTVNKKAKEFGIQYVQIQIIE